MSKQTLPDEREREHARMREALKRGTGSFVGTWHKVCDDAKLAETRWILGLQSIGIKAAHPEDAYVNRTDAFHDVVMLRNPYFNDGLRLGDLIALGEPDHYRVRKVVEIRRASFLSGWLGGPSTKFVVPK